MQAQVNHAAMRVAVLGGTGLAGRHVVDALRTFGADAIPVSPSDGVDVTTGAGLAQALSGVRRVVDVTNAATNDEGPARGFFTAAGRHLQRAAERAGVGRLVMLSIIGADRVSSGYMSAKLAHERADLSGNVPAYVLRSTQFHEFPGQVLAWGQRDGVWWVPEMLVQPVAVAAMAQVLANLVLADEPPAVVTEVAGPQQEQLVDMASRLALRRGHSEQVKGIGDDTADGQAFASGVLLPGPDAKITGPTFEKWLNAGEQVP